MLTDPTDETTTGKISNYNYLFKLCDEANENICVHKYLCIIKVARLPTPK